MDKCCFEPVWRLSERLFKICPAKSKYHLWKMMYPAADHCPSQTNGIALKISASKKDRE
jgi:hypothetical protein